MTIYIAAVHLVGGEQSEHVSQVIWVDSRNFESGKSSVAPVIDFINKHPDSRQGHRWEIHCGGEGSQRAEALS